MGLDIEWLNNMIKEHLIWAEYNLDTANELLTMNPFDKFNMLGNLSSIVNSIALTLTVLFFMIDFCNKAMLIKVNTPEEIFKLIFKIFVAKAFVTQASGLMGGIYSEFSVLANGISTSSIHIIPNYDGFSDKNSTIELFLSNATINELTNNPGILGISVLMKYISLLPTMLIIWVACLVVSVILLGRLFEVIIYTAVAPIPLSTLAGEGTHDIAKNFIKNYCAVCLQAFVIVAIFSAYGVLNSVLTSTGCDGSIMVTMSTLTLACAITKSGNIAKGICGC